MICKYCGLLKTIEEFRKNSLKCRKCLSQDTIIWQQKNKDKVWATKNRRKNKQSEYYKKWYAENGRKRDKTKMAAHTLVAIALKEGKLVRPSRCSGCPRVEKIEAHHSDYYKPLEIIWLCNRCHRETHSGY